MLAMSSYANIWLTLLWQRLDSRRPAPERGTGCGLQRPPAQHRLFHAAGIQ